MDKETAKDAEVTSSQALLFQSNTRNIVLIDGPRSLEEAQLLSSRLRYESTALNKRLVSAEPLKQPFSTPEPKVGTIGLTDSVSDLMSAAAAADALEVLRKSQSGPWCLPRVVVVDAAQVDSVAEGPKRKRHASPLHEGASGGAGQAIIPEASHYLHGTISSERERFLKVTPTFDLIVLDPPWPNRSARRKKNSYRLADNLDDIRETLLLIPLTARLAPGGLVAVWVTNNASIITLLTGPQGLFAQWGLEMVDEWIWLKVTTTGEPIVDLSSRWRKPWERLLIARRRESKTSLPSRGKVLISVPDLHSRKPSLRGLFDEVFTPDYKGLEIFARNLTAGWWSWGDEVLKFQQPEHWKDPVC